MIPLKDSQPTNRIPLWTFTLIIANIAIFFYQYTSGFSKQIIDHYALIPATINFFDLTTLYPFITSQFLHGNIFHLLSNLWFLWIFGDNVEDRVGRVLFPVIYLLSGVTGALAQYVFMTDSNIPMLGASGAIAGILGAYFVWFPHHSVKSIVGIPFFGFGIFDIPASIILIYWIVTQIFSGVGNIVGQEIGGVAYFAHIGGFIAGWIMAKVLTSRTSAYN